jgi:hypothetical protein
MKDETSEGKEYRKPSSNVESAILGKINANCYSPNAENSIIAYAVCQKCCSIRQTALLLEKL